MYHFAFNSGNLMSLFLNKNNDILHDDLDKLKVMIGNVSNDRILFTISSTVFNETSLGNIIYMITSTFPGCQLVCNSSAGNISEFDYFSGINITATIFENISSVFEVRQYEMNNMLSEDIGNQILDFVQLNPWVKAIELHSTLNDTKTAGVCDSLSSLPAHIQVFGGVACSENLNSKASFVSNQDNQFSNDALIAVYYGGDDLNIASYKISGWRPIKKVFTVTKSDGNAIQMIDNKPAFDIYKRYLNLENDDNLFANVLEFPLFCEYQGNLSIRDPLYADENGAIYMSNNVAEGTKICLSYGEPSMIISDIKDMCDIAKSFTPDVIMITSCLARDLFWQTKDYVSELQPFEKIAPCRGYLSHGEFLRENGIVNQHNTILSIGLFREGPVKDIQYDETIIEMSSSVPLVSRLGTFISRVTEELESTYVQISDMNAQLEQIATTDALTGTGNRYMFDQCVNKTVGDDTDRTAYLLMFDVNGLKFVNDTFGHSEGDVLIKAAANAITTVFASKGSCFRIGGDEFAVVAHFEDERDLEHTKKRFYNYLEEYNRKAAYTLSIAFGYSSIINFTGDRKTSSDWKMDADINMYRDKAKFHAIKSEAINPNLSEFITCIVSLVDNKDTYTAYHSVRVQRMAVMIAELCNIPEEEIVPISIAAYAHDIGKLGISDSIYAQDRKLTDEERDIIKQVPTIGKKLLSQSDDTKNIADLVLHQHEYWDGNGYPSGFRGEDIPVGSRIILIADSIDAMLNKRHYRKAMSAKDCYAELEKNSGIMYDPDIIQTVLENFGDIVKEGMTNVENV